MPLSVADVSLMLVYLLQTYGKGTARDCRRHVQKLNMARGEKEKGGLRGSHPPRDYAHAFTTQNGRKKEAQEVRMIEG